MKQGHVARNAGFSLVEVLISALVLSIGLLGLAGLHVTGMRSNHSAFYRSQATVLSYEIIDRMRANAGQARANAYDVESIAAFTGSGDTTAQTDLADWKRNLSVLPSFDGSIDCATTGDCLVVVQWDDSRAEREVTETGSESDSDSSTAASGEGDGTDSDQGAATRKGRSANRQFSVRTRV
jgi:type IV pilus assembly protein PilV